MASELEGCPFCGAEPCVIESGERYYVTCGDATCYCSLGEVWDRDAMPDHAFDNEAEAIAAWNRRTPTPGLIIREEAARVVYEAEFLIARLDEVDWCDLDEMSRQWAGHVDPPLARLRAALRALPDAVPAQDEGEGR